MIRKIYGILFLVLVALRAGAGNVIDIPLCVGDATEVLQNAIEKVADYEGEAVTLRLMPGNYNISRDKASRHIYHVSNTTSAEENPDPTKHIGLWLRNLKNVTVDGRGASLITHGEMTTFVIDNCENITLKNFTLTAADPSVPEIKILATSDTTVTFEVVAPSQFVVEDGHFHFKGEGWIVADGGRLTSLPEYAQVFYPDRNVTLRCNSPLKGYSHARQIDERTIVMEYEHVPDVHPGEHYQIRHGIRNEVCGFINQSKNVEIENAEFNFLGNFGIVGQFSENITYDNIRCRPRPGSGRTDAGFADFLQMSGCKGLLRIANSQFVGAHDDPINIHGTHLKAIASEADDKLTVRYMHGQTYGFQPFFKGDEVELVDRHTLNCLAPAKVKDVRKVNDYDFELTLDRQLPLLPDGYGIEDIAVENVTWTPEVEIIDNYFARTPTRGILITTRGKSLFHGNTFFRIPMSAILVSDDARSWYESGPVSDLTISGNTFIECSSPMIAILPEIDRFGDAVHRNIMIEDNRFIMNVKSVAIRMNATANIVIRNNTFDIAGQSSATIDSIIEAENITGLAVSDNLIILNR